MGRPTPTGIIGTGGPSGAFLRIRESSFPPTAVTIKATRAYSLILLFGTLSSPKITLKIGDPALVPSKSNMEFTYNFSDNNPNIIQSRFREITPK